MRFRPNLEKNKPNTGHKHVLMLNAASVWFNFPLVVWKGALVAAS